MGTQADEHIALWDKGLWRTARAEHACDWSFNSRTCKGDGLIRRGDRYFDTQELREWTKGPKFYRACERCALHPSPLTPQEGEIPPFSLRFRDPEYTKGFC